MRFSFGSGKLQRLYTADAGAARYPEGIVDAFFDVVATIRAVDNESELYALKSFHCEKLKGRRGLLGQYSLRLNKQWRLIFTIQQDRQGRFLRIEEIADYHKG